MLAELLLSLAPASLAATSVAAPPVESVVREDDETFRAYAFLEKKERNDYLNRTFPGKKGQRKEQRQFKQRYEDWLKSFRSEGEICRAFGFPESPESALFTALAETPRTTQLDFDKSLRSIGKGAEFNQRRSAWRQAEADKANAARLADERVRAIHQSLGEIEWWTRTTREQETWTRNIPRIRTGSYELTRAAQEVEKDPAGWRAHLAEHAGCPGGEWDAVLAPFLDGDPRTPLDTHPTILEVRDALWNAGHREVALSFASEALDEDTQHLHEEGRSQLIYVRMSLLLGPPWSTLHTQARLEEYLERDETRAEALELIALGRILATTGPLSRPGLTEADVRAGNVSASELGMFVADHEEDQRRLREEGQAAAVSLEGLPPHSTLGLEVLGSYALVERRSAKAFGFLEEAAKRAGSTGESLVFAAPLVPVAHAMARGPEGLAARLGPWSSGARLRLMANLADAWGCAPTVLGVLSPEEAEPWRRTLALRHLRVGETDLGLNLFERADVDVGALGDLVHAWLLVAANREDEAKERATAAVLRGGRDEPALWRSARLVHDGTERLNEFLAASADPGLAALDAWESELGERPVGALAERAFLLAAVGSAEDAAPLLRSLEEADPALARDTWSDLAAFSRESAEAAARAAVRALDGSDTREQVRLAAARMGIDDAFRSRGLDGLRVELEETSRRWTAGRAELFAWKGVFPPEWEAEDPDAKEVPEDPSHRRIVGEDGKDLPTLTFWLDDGTKRTMRELGGGTMVVYLHGQGGPGDTGDWVENLNHLAELDCTVLLLFIGAEKAMVHDLGSRPLSPDVLRGRLDFNDKIPPEWPVAYPSIWFIDESGKLERYLSMPNYFREVLDRVRQ